MLKRSSERDRVDMCRVLQLIVVDYDGSLAESGNLGLHGASKCSSPREPSHENRKFSILYRCAMTGEAIETHVNISHRRVDAGQSR